MARPSDSLRNSLLILAAIGERLQNEDVRAEAAHALIKLETLEAELEATRALYASQQSVIEAISAGPSMKAIGKRKLIQLQGDGYIVNGVALYHPITGRRGLLDYLGYVGWVKTNDPAPPAFIVGDTPTWRNGAKAYTVTIEDNIVQIAVIDGARIEFVGEAKLSDCAKPDYTTGHCEHHNQPGGCHLHNLYCGYPKCDRKPKEPT